MLKFLFTSCPRSPPPPPLSLLLTWASFVYQAEEGAGDAQRRRARASERGARLRNTVPEVSKFLCYEQRIYSVDRTELFLSFQDQTGLFALQMRAEM